MAQSKLKGNSEWVQIKDLEWTASDKNDSPLEAAVVYESANSQLCGHAFRLDPLIRYLEESTAGPGVNQKTTCPLCNLPIELVCDRMTKILEDDKASKDKAPSGDNKIVTFKYRNHLYRLSVMRPGTDRLPIYYQFCLWAWQSIMEYCGEATAMTAQERIAHVLNMDLQSGMKVRGLHCCINIPSI
jgi:hypothetical protein